MSNEPISPEDIQKSEGRHLAGLDSADKIDETFKKYRKSPKGKAAYKRYQTSEKFKETRKKYFQSPKGKIAVRRWLDSEKGQEYMNDRKFGKKVFRLAAKFQQENSDWTSDDCLEKALEELLEKEN